MHKRLAFLTAASAAAIALPLATDVGFAGNRSTTLGAMTVAQGEKTVPEPPPSEGGPGASVLKPKPFPETPAEVKECMESWDPQTGMSREEYEQSCKRTLRYFPENAE